jgi:hypothetical protein
MINRSGRYHSKRQKQKKKKKKQDGNKTQHPRIQQNYQIANFNIVVDAPLFVRERFHNAEHPEDETINSPADCVDIGSSLGGAPILVKTSSAKSGDLKDVKNGGFDTLLDSISHGGNVPVGE